MKRVIAAFVLLAMLFLGCFALLSQMEGKILLIKEQIEAASLSVSLEKNSPPALELARLNEMWKNEKNLFHALSGSISCDPIDSALNRARVWAAKEKSPELLSELSNIYSLINDLWDTQSLHILNML